MSMCIRAGSDELETVKNLMGMSLKAVVAEALGVELDSVREQARLEQDLGLGPANRELLGELIADTFDGLEVDFDAIGTFEELLDRVVLNEFKDVDRAAAEL